eukprot:gene14601-biopygen2774
MLALEKTVQLPPSIGFAPVSQYRPLASIAVSAADWYRSIGLWPVSQYRPLAGIAGWSRVSAAGWYRSIGRYCDTGEEPIPRYWAQADTAILRYCRYCDTADTAIPHFGAAPNSPQLWPLPAASTTSRSSDSFPQLLPRMRFPPNGLAAQLGGNCATAGTAALAGGSGHKPGSETRSSSWRRERCSLLSSVQFSSVSFDRNSEVPPGQGALS